MEEFAPEYDAANFVNIFNDALAMFLRRILIMLGNVSFKF